MSAAIDPDDYLSTHRARQERFTPSPGEPFKHLRVLSPEDCATSPARNYLVKTLMAASDLVLVFGQPGTGKSIISPHIGYAVSQGRMIYGHRVKRGPVLYVPAEDPHGMRQRIHALKLEYGDAPDFHLVEGVSDLFANDSPDRGALAALANKIRPALIVIDTIAAAFPGLRENESEDMARVLAFAKELRDTGAAVILVHHAPKGDDTTPRGHGSLNGSADVTLRLSIDTDTATVTGKLGKNRNGPSGVTIGFAIRSMLIGTDEDGDPVTAPIADEADPDTYRASQRPKLTKSEASATQFLADLIIAKGFPLPSGSDFPPGLLGVSEADWREVCESRRLSTAETAKDRGRVFRDVYKNLLVKRVVAARDGLVWLTHLEEVRP